MGTRTDPIRTAFKNMALIIITLAAVAAFARWGVPTAANVAGGLQAAVRALASATVAVYVAGGMTREWVAGVADFAQRLTSQPLQTVLDLIPTVEPQPELLTVLGAQILEPEALDLEIAAYDEAAKTAKRPAARRKPATAPKAAVAA